MTRKKLVALISALLLGGCQVNEEIREENILDNKYVFYMESDTEDPYEEVEKLGILNDCYHRFDSYKVIKYTDTNSFGKIALVLPYISFIVNENGNIISKECILYDAIKDVEIIRLKCNNNKDTYGIDIDNIVENEYIKKIHFIGDLKSLKKIALEKGMNSEYVNSIYTDYNDNEMLLVSEAAYIYVSLVNSYNRPNFDNNKLVLKQ